MNTDIALIYMGGTFGCVGDPLAPMPADAFIPQLCNLIEKKYQVKCFQAPQIKDSSACQAQDWLELVYFIQDLIKKNYQYFVIIHGTDTLSYASAVLSHCLAQSAHVILTGSQYPLLNTCGNELREFSDAMDNLTFALEKVKTSDSGVYLTFHQQLIHAQTALKIHTTELAAFAGLDAQINIQKPKHAKNITLNDIEKAKSFNCMSLMIQPIDIDLQIQNLKQLLIHPPHFLFLQGFGTGNLAVNADFIQLIDELYEKGCATVLTTQVPFGGTDQRYAIADWVKHSKVLLNESHGHADLYAKALKMYLQYDAVEQWHRHWYE